MNGIIQVQFVGRLGNQLQQYCSMKAYALSIGAEFETAPWWGREVFVNATEPDYSCELPGVNDGACGHEPSLQEEQTNVRVSGYFMMQRWAGLLSRVQCREWLQINPSMIEACGPKIKPWYMAAHVRQGDSIGSEMYCQVKESSYLRACEKHHLPIEHLVWVRENEPRIIPGIPHWLPDFVTLARSDILLRANSSYSWWAAMISTGKVFSPVVEDRVGPREVEFVEGNWPRIADTNRTGVKVEDLYVRD